MNKLAEIHNEIQNLNTDARRVLTRELLNAEARRLDNSLIPLDANHKEEMEKERNERICIALVCTAAAAGICALTAWGISKGKQKIEAKAAEEKAKLEDEKKELYRKLSALKGRR